MRQQTPPVFCDSLVLRRLAVDDLSNVRYLHAQSFRCLVASEVDDDDAMAVLAQIASPDYGDHLLAERQILAFYQHELVGTAGWSFAPVGTPEARLVSIFVHPAFTRIGIARRLVAAIEDDARGLGFESLTSPVPEHAARFLRRLGFSAPSHEAAQAGAGLTTIAARRIVAPSRTAQNRGRNKGHRPVLSLV